LADTDQGGLDLPLRTSVHHWHTMESLEDVVVPVVLVGALLLGAIWTTVVTQWLRSTKPIIGRGR